MKAAILKLVGTLDAIALDHPEVWDSAVREQIYLALERGYADADETYVLPKHFAMFSRKADARVREAVCAFIQTALAAAEAAGLEGSAARCRALDEAGEGVVSRRGLRFVDCVGCLRTTEVRRQGAEEGERSAQERSLRDAAVAVDQVRLLATRRRLGQRAFDLLDELDGLLQS
ncbi:hypothetical protein CCAX7_62080 [Capsulimonas corticalis]|uniref:Uncharacterized protein n=1 Tax=Capsulimonas corticalis TaxID=2219043 RepID=A0A402CWJ5_9BACT|nr:hypothetical protein [Capsulimonas corticalis]BDI34157.1 hypothetical protein CCAX7_62080 [Capsulimonas corticalis]